ncbi:MAG TPA: hypothetical protein VJ731_03440 [Terriglobales bacterium]|nr:hypothetical protein [Terriglobales bacterium]
MPKKPTAEDAQIIMRLYDLRRESEMRKARAWFAGFWPKDAHDIIRVVNGADPQENAWFRQVTGYWEMASSFVLRGALSEELFFDSGGELWFILSKVHPFLKEVREKTNNSYLFQRMEKIASRTKEGRERLQMMLKRAEARRAAAAKA